MPTPPESKLFAKPPQSPSTQPARELARGRPLAFLVLYVALAVLANWSGYRLRLGGETLTTMWIPTGLLLAALMFAPYRLWVAVVAVHTVVEVAYALLIETPPGHPLWTLYLSLAGSLNGLLGAFVLKRTIGEYFAPTRVRTVICFLGVALLAPIAGAALGAFGVQATNPGASWMLAWRTWWFGDSLGILAMVPLLMALGGDLRPPPSRLSSGGRFEYWTLMTSLVVLSLWIFGSAGALSGGAAAMAGILDAPLVVGPILIWAALRFGPRAVSIALALTSILCIREAVAGRGPFVRPPFGADEAVIAIQAFLAVTLSSILLLTAMVQALRLTLAETRESRERLDQLARRINAVLWMFEPETMRFLYVSPAYEAIWRRPAAALEEHPWDWFDAIHPEDKPRIQEAAINRRAEDGSTRSVDLTFRILRGEGEVRWIWSRSFPVPARAGEPAREVGNAIDITHQRAAEEQQMELERQLLQAQKMEAVGQLASGIAHDLNNVLTVVQGHAQLLADPTESQAERSESLEALEDAVGQARGVTSSLLTFARGLSGERTPFNVCEAVTETASLLRRTLPASVELELAIPEDDPMHVLGDRTQVQQVVLNLAINARDAMPEGGRLRVAVERAQGPVGVRQPLVRLTVRDTGQGIPAEAREHLFEPFFTTKERGRGTGLGLSVVLGIVGDHGGDIRVDSSLGRGTCFIVDLPRLSATEIEAPKMTEPQEPVRGDGQRLLLAEDSDGIRKLLVQQLTKLGFEIDEVSDGHALAEAVNGDPQGHRLWVLDLDLPRRSGLSCLEEFRANGWDTPAILITGDAGASADERIDERTEIVLKPFTIPELAERIRVRLMG